MRVDEALSEVTFFPDVVLYAGASAKNKTGFVLIFPISALACARQIFFFGRCGMPCNM